MTSDRIFKGNFPTGIVYADRECEVNRDYKRLAYMNYKTLKLEFAKECPVFLAEEIEKDAAKIQAKKGEFYQITTCGQGVILGETEEEAKS